MNINLRVAIRIIIVKHCLTLNIMRRKLHINLIKTYYLIIMCLIKNLQNYYTTYYYREVYINNSHN